MAPSARLPGLNTLRALAIALVMLFHTRGYQPESLQLVSRTGWMGVDLFFVLSGYLIGLQLLRPCTLGRTPSLADFYRRRAFRILPAYLTVLALYLLWPAWREAPHLSPVWQFLTFTENLNVDYAHNQAFSHVWSLCIEEHFYLVLPLAVLALTSRRRPSLRLTVSLFAGVLAFGILFRSWVLFHTLRAVSVDDDTWSVLYLERIYYPTWSRLDGLLAGVGLATLQLFRPTWWQSLMRRGHFLSAAGLVLTATAVWMFWDRFTSDTGLEAFATILGFPILSLGLALLVASAVSRNGLLARRALPGADLLATLAFSLYLTHKEVAALVHRLLPAVWTTTETWPTLLLYASACLLAAAILYLTVERPSLLLRDRLNSRISR